jgi:hypothetical protein
MFIQSFQDAPPATASVEEVHAAAPSNSWSWTIEPFLWLAGLDGQGSADSSPPSNVEFSPSDFFGHFDGGFLLALEARPAHSNWGLLADGLYLRLVDDEGSLQTQTEATMLEAGGALAVDRAGEVELLAGLRYVDLSLDVDRGAVIDASGRASWVDPWIGARARFPLDERWTLALRGDIGGFGVGSQFSWQALVGLGVDLGASWRLDLGYRALAIDFNGGDLNYDLLVYGPLIGIAWRP